MGFFTDGINLPVNHRQTVHRNGTLIVHMVQRAFDSGTYSCEARNNQGAVARQDVTVIVMGKFSSDLYIFCRV